MEKQNKSRRINIIKNKDTHIHKKNKDTKESDNKIKNIEGSKMEIKTQKEIENINKRIKENDNEIINDIKIKDEELNLIGIKSYDSYEKGNKSKEYKKNYPKQIEKKKKKCHEMRFNEQNIIEKELKKEENLK